MIPIAKALWFIETALGEENLTLDDIARAASVSRFHLARSFSVVLGQPVMRYVRARRLSEAARNLSRGAPDILSVAIGHGYGSHEAFTRAFAEQFGMTPSDVRKAGDLAALDLQEPVRMTLDQHPELAPPRIETITARRLIGLSRHYTGNDFAGITSQWPAYFEHASYRLSATDGAHYGVCYNMTEAGDMDYLTGVEAAPGHSVPEAFSEMIIPAGEYAVFRHEGHISLISQTFAAAFQTGLPQLNRESAPGPSFEWYSADFDPMTGAGHVEVWIPLA